MICTFRRVSEVDRTLDAGMVLEWIPDVIHLLAIVQCISKEYSYHCVTDAGYVIATASEWCNAMEKANYRLLGTVRGEIPGEIEVVMTRLPPNMAEPYAEPTLVVATSYVDDFGACVLPSESLLYAGDEEGREAAKDDFKKRLWSLDGKSRCGFSTPQYTMVMHEMNYSINNGYGTTEMDVFQRKITEEYEPDITYSATYKIKWKPGMA